jgi:hypothetical protein
MNNRMKNVLSVFGLAGLIGLLAVLGLGTGCRTISPGGRPSVEVILASDGTAQLGATTFPLKELSAHLKREGAGAETAVFLIVPLEMPQSAMAIIARDLRKAGFRKIIFKRPMKPDALVKKKGAE